jgi:hypothetical protein
MKKHLFLLITFCFSMGLLYAQPDEIANKVEAIQIAFLTKELKLTPDEAQKFWPVYNNYRSELKKISATKRRDELELEENVLNIRKKYKPDFRRVLDSDDRVNRIFKVEKSYREMLRKELLNRQRQGKRFGGNFKQRDN